jgi:small neutral amino acid transporter SnatA (MarC family)
MFNNFVQAWKTTILGSMIILASLVFVWFGKINASEFLLIGGFGLGLMGTDILKEKQNAEQKNN